MRSFKSIAFERYTISPQFLARFLRWALIVSSKLEDGNYLRRVACVTFEAAQSFDLSDGDFWNFVRFLFDHQVANRDAGESPWYEFAEPDVVFDEVEQTKLYIQLFANSTLLFDRYTREQLEQGFWAVTSCLLPGSVYDLLWQQDVPIGLLEECIDSMHPLFRDFFARDALPGGACNMWWDSLAYGYCCGNQSRDNERERRIQDSMFATLCRILALNSTDCQKAALHGLGHLRHPDTEAIIRHYMEEHPELSEKERDYCEGCITGHIM